jgi:hypothetical protein
MVGVDEVEGVDEFTSVRSREKIAAFQGREDVSVVCFAQPSGINELRRLTQPGGVNRRFVGHEDHVKAHAFLPAG